MDRFWSLDAFLLLPNYQKILLLLLGVLLGGWVLVFLISRLRVWWQAKRLHPHLAAYVDLPYLRQLFRHEETRWGFLPEQGMVSLLDYFVERFSRQVPLERNHILLLGPSGSGKTHLLLRFYARMRRAFQSKKAFYLSLPQHPDFDFLDQLDLSEDTLIILDGLDEDPLVYQDFGARMDQIVERFKPFRKLILACSHARFAELLSLEEAYFTYTGPRQSLRFALCELVPLDGTGVRRSDKTKKSLLALWPELGETPLWWQSLRTARLDGGERYYYQVFRRRIHQELEPLYRDKTAAAQQFLEAIAGSMYRQWENHKSLQLGVEEVESLALAFGIEWRSLQKNMLLILAGGVVQFRHVAYLSFFLSRAAFRDELKTELTHFEGLPMARTFFLEMAWLCFDDADIHGYFRSRFDRQKRSLNELNAAELPQITNLYLDDLTEKDTRFLRMLKQLQDIHLSIAQVDLKKVDWIADLPPQQIQVYQRHESKGFELWRSRRVNDERRLQLFAPFDYLQAQQKLSPLHWPQLERGRKDILNLFHLDLCELPDEFCEEDSPIRNSLGEEVRRFKRRLGHLEWDLFNSLEVLQFSDGSYNVKLSHEHRPTMLMEMVNEIVSLLFKTYGEDDFHRTTLTDDDLNQIEDGLWLGRVYTWQNSAYYAYPLHFYMPAPEQFVWLICGLNTERVSELQP